MHTVEDRIEKAGSEFDRKRPAQSVSHLARSQTAGVLIQLGERGVPVAADHFADQADLADANLLADNGFR